MSFIDITKIDSLLMFRKFRKCVLWHIIWILSLIVCYKAFYVVFFAIFNVSICFETIIVFRIIGNRNILYTFALRM